MDFSFQSKYEHSIPPASEQPVLAQNESLYRFLLKATREDPDDRFQTADEMADQLIGILRETVATDAEPRPAENLHFGPDQMPLEDPGPDYHILPALKLDLLDTGANAAITAAVTAAQMPVPARERLLQQYPDSAELPQRLASAYIGLGRFAEAAELLAKVDEKDPFDWRTQWYRGISALAAGNAAEAVKLFDRVYSELPGELVPKLALAMASESAGNPGMASKYYEIVARTNPEYTSAAFGLARSLAKAGDAKGAVAAFKRVPASSIHYTQAQMAMARAIIQSEPGCDEFACVSAALETLSIEGMDKHVLCAQVFSAALGRLKFLAGSASITVLGEPLHEPALRRALERELRACASFAGSLEAKIALIDHANRQRPITLI